MTTFPGKLLLFGEYVVLIGGNALSAPLPNFGGGWTYEEPDVPLAKAQGLLSNLAKDTRLRALPWLDLDRMQSDLEAGRWLTSNIPSGYGLGSSGMVTAAIYYAYAIEKTEDQNLLRTQLAAIESFFHGYSSGIDPLTSYLNQVLFINHADTTITLYKQLPITPYHIYLLNSNQKRNTAELVQRFKQRLAEDAEFAEGVTEMKVSSDLMIQAYLDPRFHVDVFTQSIQTFSDLQLDLMHDFIPPAIAEVWKHGRLSNQYTMKLCGAGGGGFFLLFSLRPLTHQLQSFELIKVG